jgi:hypothetical protein
MEDVSGSADPDFQWYSIYGEVIELLNAID